MHRLFDNYCAKLLPRRAAARAAEAHEHTRSAPNTLYSSHQVQGELLAWVLVQVLVEVLLVVLVVVLARGQVALRCLAH
jgi:ABC-type molybdate transport system permease subunit